MATLLIQSGGEPRRVCLPATALIGRAASCAVRLDDPSVPMHWLELRWSARGWRWRTLSGEARTRGVGALLEDGWRLLPDSVASRPQRVRYGEHLAVELVEGGPPARFMADLQTGETVTDEALESLVEVRPDALLRVDAEEDGPRVLRDGDVVVREGRAWRVHLAEAPDPTWKVRIDLARGDASVEVADDGFRATVHQGGAQAELVGEHVRALAVYAAARTADQPRGGWLSVDGAWAAWVEAGGNPESPLERLAWDRARCRTRLAQLGVGGLDALFECRRIGGRPHYRLGLTVE